MDYYSLPRKQLQALCKKHGIPANSTNVSMADALKTMLNDVRNIKPLDEGFQKPEHVSQDRGDDSVLTEVSNTPKRSTRSKRLVIAEEDKSAKEPVVIEIEGTPIAPKGKGVKSSNKTLERRPRTRTGSKKVLDMDMVNKDGSLPSSEVDESADSVTALNSVKMERSGPVKGSRNARTPKTKYCCTDGNEDLEQLEDKQGSDEKEENTAKANGELVEEAPRTRTKGRSSRKKVEVEEAIEDSSIQEEHDASKNETTPICRRSTRASACKLVDAHPSQNRSSYIKKTGNAESIKKTPATVSKTRRLKLSPMTENLTDNEEEGDQAEEAVKVRTKKNLLAKASNSSNNDVISSVRTRRALRNSQKDPTGILNKDALDESANKVKQMPTLRGRNSVRNAHQAISLETQEESNSESDSSDVKQERESYRKITRKAVGKDLGKDKHKCTEEIDVTQAALNAKEDTEVVENKTPEDLESIDETESEEMKCEIIVQPKPTTCQNFEQKHASSDISQTESSDQVENKSIAEISSRSSKDHQSTPISDSYGSRIVKELNVYNGKLSIEHGIVSTGMTSLSRPVENLDTLTSVDQLGALKVKGSSCLKYSTNSMVAEESPIEKGAFTSSVEAQMGEFIGIQDGEVGEKMVNDDVNVAESHNGIGSVTVRVDFKGEEDAPLSHYQKISNFNKQELQCSRDLSSSCMEAIDNLFELQEKVVSGEPGNAAVLALNTSGEECLDPKAVYDFKIVGEKTELQLIPTNLVEETKQDTTEANLQDSSLLIDEVSDSDDTEEKNKNVQSFEVVSDISQVHYTEVTVFVNGDQDVEEEISSDLDSNREENQDVQDSDLSFEVAPDVSQVQDREVTGFTNAEGEVLEASGKIESGEDCQDVNEEISSDLDSNGGENQDVQDSDLSFEVAPDISQVQDRKVTGFANAEGGQVLEASGKIESGEDCQDVDEEISSDLDSNGGEYQDVQEREVTGFANAEGQVLEASGKIKSDEDCLDVEEEILSDLDDTEVENQDAQDSDNSFKVISNILQVQNREVTGFANVESQDIKASEKVESGEACRNKGEEKMHALTSLPEETKDSATQRKLDIVNTLLPTRQSFEEESTGLGIAKQDQEACNDTVEGNHTCQSSPSDNVSEADPVKKLTTSCPRAVGEVKIENSSFQSDGRQKEADQSQGCISHLRMEGSNVHSQARSRTSCFAEVLIFNENSAGRSDFIPLLCTKEEANMQNQISDMQVSPTADLEVSVASACQSVHNIDCLKSDMMATMKSFETGNGGQTLGVNEKSVLHAEKYLPGIAAQDSEQTNIKETEFSVKASYEGKMPAVVEDTSFHPQDACCVGTLCEKFSLAGDSQELSSSESTLALMKPYPVEKAPDTLIKDSRQQRKMLTDLIDGQNNILHDVFQNAPLESARCELQKENPPQLNALSLRKLRALLKKKNIPRNNGQKEGERLVLRDLTSIELEKRNKVQDNTQL